MVCSDFNDWAKCIIYEHFKVNCMISISQKRQKLKRWKWLFFIVCFYHVTYAFQSESTLYSCLNVKELLTLSRCEIWSLSDCNGTRTHNHLVCKRTFNHLAKLAKWLSCVVGTYLYSAFDCMFLSCHVREISRLLRARSSLTFRQL